MQPIAGWLVATPQNAVLALALMLLLPLAPVLGGAIVVLLTLRHGVLRAVMLMSLATAVLLVVGLFANVPVWHWPGYAAISWLPALLLGTALRNWRSVTLALQLSVIGGAAVLLAIYVATGSTTSVGEQLLSQFAALMAQAGYADAATMLLDMRADFAAEMLLFDIFARWLSAVLALLLGYLLVRTLSDDKAPFGRICDLDYGRVLAMLIGLLSVVAWLASLEWMQNVAALMLAMFCLQGLAIFHWLCAAGRLPGSTLVLVYVATVFLHAFAVLALSVSGYLDAWFGVRKRLTANK